MSRESASYDEARQRRIDARAQNPSDAAHATELALDGLSSGNAEARGAFWKKLEQAIIDAFEDPSAPAECAEAAGIFARIFGRLARVAEGHPPADDGG
jgi:hypothetical protein